MRFKFVFLILILLLCCGCNVEYELNIDDYLKLNEFVSIKAISESEKNKINDYDGYLPVDVRTDDYRVYEQKFDDVEYYNIDKKYDNSKLEVGYSFNIDNFNYSMIAASCFDFLSAVDTDNKLVLSTSRGFLCFENYPELESVNVKITTKREVYSNNADYIEGNTYIWNITEGNKDDIYINMSLSSEPIEKKISFWEKNLLLILVISVIVVGTVVYLIFKKRSEKINEI